MCMVGSKLGPKITNLWEFLAKDHDVVRAGKLDEHSNYDSGETEKYARKLEGHYGEHPDQSTRVSGRPAE